MRVRHTERRPADDGCCLPPDRGYGSFQILKCYFNLFHVQNVQSYIQKLSKNDIYIYTYYTYRQTYILMVVGDPFILNSYIKPPDLELAEQPTCRDFGADEAMHLGLGMAAWPRLTSRTGRFFDVFFPVNMCHR